MTSTEVTTAIGGPRRHHSTPAATAAGWPWNTTNTLPSARLLTEPANPSSRARLAQVTRKKTPWTRPLTVTRTRRTGR